MHNSGMAADSIHTVFISSTFEDLREERAQVQKAVLRLGCLPIGMELFPSADNDAWGYIKGEIERSDFYVLIVGGKYGSVAPDGISYTQKEYLYAKELKKPILVFVRSSTALVSEDKREHDEGKRKKLEAFINELNDARLAQRFENNDQLGAEAYHSLNRLRISHPGGGYVKAGQQMLTSPKDFDLAPLGIKITNPKAGRSPDKVDISGTIKGAVPSGFELWAFRVYDNRRFYPLRSCTVLNTGIWEAGTCFLGGKPGDTRRVTVNLVGHDGLALIAFFKEGYDTCNAIRNRLVEKVGDQGVPFFPSVFERTNDIFECDSVQIVRS